ncbi:hypothetical protein F0562_011485 [Nyssa sinensis]|uniref:Glycosyl transferase CAP10 domain-containing protein n=1 Tax=Nyssa sinensis TaxID=561372 RepID=A0A5J4ZTU4_9ASTE|nr:hypothetical protein F0562_011485 [Nyssa sinensis]
MQRFSSKMWRRTGLDRHISDTQIWQQPLKKRPATASMLFLSILIAAVLTFSSWINPSSFSVTNVTENRTSAKRIEIPLSCSAGNLTQTCPVNYPASFETEDHDPSLNSSCPDYFRWIHEDLRPFKSTGITRDMVERAKRTAHFRVVIVKGRIYVEKYKKSIQTRDVFTLWGILQLLRRYPGRLPDLEMMFDCNDRPVIRSRDYRGPNATAPPPLFRYCGDRWNLDIVFPDWSFWGWAEIKIKPWESILKELKEGNSRKKWMAREPYAYWKGNPSVARTRRDLLKCNVSDKQDWNARLFVQAQAIGKAASDFIQQELKMDYVYDYMFHLLNEYAKLLKFKPEVPDKAVEFCSETMACPADGIEKRFMMESLVKGPSITSPCTIPPPYDPQALGPLSREKLIQWSKWRHWREATGIVLINRNKCTLRLCLPVSLKSELDKLVLMILSDRYLKKK